MLSIPAPPEIVSEPPPEVIVSLPAPPLILSAPKADVSVLVIESPYEPPVTVNAVSLALLTVKVSPCVNVVTLASSCEPSISSEAPVNPEVTVIVTLPTLLSAPKSMAVTFSTLLY